MRKLSAQLFLIVALDDRLAPAVVWKRDDQMSGPTGGLATPVAGGAGEPQSMARVRFQPPPCRRPGHRARRSTSRFLLSRKVACREAPSNHPGDKHLRGQAGDGVDPRDAVAAAIRLVIVQAECSSGIAV